MNSYILSTCSTLDKSFEYVKERNIEYIKFVFLTDGKENFDDLGQTLSYDKFYQMMRDGVDTKTSQPNVQDYKNYFEPFLKEGKDVIHLNLSSGLSGAQTSAKIAREELLEKYPERKLYVIDSLGASAGMGLLVDKMADLRDEGMSIDDLAKWAEENKLKLHHWFFSTDLTFYVKGGRVSKVAGWFGTVLKICPLLNMDLNGKLIPRQKIKGKASVIKEIVKKMEENAEGGLNYNGKCYISHADSYEDARMVADLVEAKFPSLNGKVEISSIGTTIGSHTGPGTVALFFFGNERKD
ncbi:MAG: DegV family protein [Clostridia bacterium]|nr:DegV family protein [Clostridia bacterium]MBO5439094.1 DegV family protein [Clostridia bacterium]